MESLLPRVQRPERRVGDRRLQGVDGEPCRGHGSCPGQPWWRRKPRWGLRLKKMCHTLIFRFPSPRYRFWIPYHATFEGRVYHWLLRPKLTTFPHDLEFPGSYLRMRSCSLHLLLQATAAIWCKLRKVLNLFRNVFGKVWLYLLMDLQFRQVSIRFMS